MVFESHTEGSAPGNHSHVVKLSNQKKYVEDENTKGQYKKEIRGPLASGFTYCDFRRLRAELFPRSIERGSIEARASDSLRLYMVKFPRSIERGSIEAPSTPSAPILISRVSTLNRAWLH